jgi:hypothetical protein
VIWKWREGSLGWWESNLNVVSGRWENNCSFCALVSFFVINTFDILEKRKEAAKSKTNASESWGEVNKEELLTKTPKYYCSVTDYDFKFLGNGRQINQNLTVQNLGVLH